MLVRKVEQSLPLAIGRMLRRLSLVVAAALAVVSLAITPAAFAKDKEHAGADLGPGCAPDRPAIAHYAGGVIAESPRDNVQTRAPIPCTTRTGWRTSEAGMVVTNTGSVLVQPAFDAAGSPIGIIRSTDAGASWQFVQPSNPDNPPRRISQDENIGIDRRTGRVFWFSPGYNAARLSLFQVARLDISNDDGQTWFRASVSPLGEPNPLTGQVSTDHVQVFTGAPPASLKPRMQGYPDVVYVCGGDAPQLCGHSVDGGTTFDPPVAIPLPPECDGPLPPLAPDVPFNTNFGLSGVVGQGGTVYVPNAPCNIPYVAISHDAGDSWQLVKVANTRVVGYGMLSLDIDKEGSLYASWVDFSDRLPYLSISRDHGLHWSTQLMIGAPGVNEAALPSLVAGDRGQVAVAYYGSTNSPGPPFPPPCTGISTSCPAYQNETWNTYVTESFNALAQQPLFWSATLNDPAQPTYYGCSTSEVGVVIFADTFAHPPGAHFSGCGVGAGGHFDYFGMNIASDGTPWVAFPQACPQGMPVAGNPNCDQAAGGPSDGLWGMVGRLVRVPGEDGSNDH